MPSTASTAAGLMTGCGSTTSARASLRREELADIFYRALAD